MSRLNLLLSWFFTSLGIALLVVLPLLAPEKAFADAGCEFDCCYKCFDNPPGSGCNEQTYCYQQCYTNCTSGVATCDSTSCTNCSSKCLINAAEDGCTYSVCINSVNCAACKCNVYKYDMQWQCCCF